MPNSIDYDESFIYDQKNDRPEDYMPKYLNFTVVLKYRTPGNDERRHWVFIVSAEDNDRASELARDKFVELTNLSERFIIYTHVFCTGTPTPDTAMLIAKVED